MQLGVIWHNKNFDEGTREAVFYFFRICFCKRVFTKNETIPKHNVVVFSLQNYALGLPLHRI